MTTGPTTTPGTITAVQDAMGNPTNIHLNGFTGDSFTRNYSLYLRDSWSVGWAPGLTPAH